MYVSTCTTLKNVTTERLHVFTGISVSVCVCAVLPSNKKLRLLFSHTYYKGLRFNLLLTQLGGGSTYS